MRHARAPRPKRRGLRSLMVFMAVMLAILVAELVASLFALWFAATHGGS